MKTEGMLPKESSDHKDEYNQVIEKALRILEENTEWKLRYASYASKILTNIDTITRVRKSFHEWLPLRLYISAGNAMKSTTTVRFELRYLGQTVAQLMNGISMHLDTSCYDKENERDFGCSISLRRDDWNGYKAKEFRRFFRERDSARNAGNKNNNEHRLESLLISTFSEKSGKKALVGIQPVKIANIRFAMPTPLSASRHGQIKYSGKGGGIDILTRTGTGGKNTCLCIMEVKDENTRREPPKDAIKQALAYATFIHELLRSDSGPAWWKLYGFKRSIPDKLVLQVACVMPSNKNDDHSFGGIDLDIKGDIVRLHYLYFTEVENQISLIDTSINRS